MYALTCDCSTRCSSDIDVIIKAPSKGMAWNMLLSDEGSEKFKQIVGQTTSYYLFEIDGLTLRPKTHSVVACDPEHIEFKFPAGSARKHFEKFCKTTFGEVLYKMTNDQFADNYDNLAEWFVYGDDKRYGGCTDDPFKCWDLRMLPLTHFDSVDKYVVLESKTHYYRDATVFSSSKEYPKHDCCEFNDDTDELCSTDEPKYYSHQMSSVKFL